MSRIDQALERARQMQGVDVPAGTAPEGAPAEALFSEAWEVGRDVGQPAPAPPREVAPPAPPRPQAVVDARPRVSRPTLSRVNNAVASEVHPNLLEKVVSTVGAPMEAIEQYRRLTARLHHLQLEQQIKRIMVISAVSGEGKTLTSMNLALTLSRSHERRVLLIDTDLRRPSLHDAFGVPGEPGLREAVQQSPLEPVPIVNIDEHLSLLPAGRPTTDPMQVLSSERTRAIISEAANEYDWVIVDTAPLAVLPDANVLADAVDAAVLVISAGSTPHDLVQKAVQLLGRERILGVVLNSVEPYDMNAAGYYAQYYPQA